MECNVCCTEIESTFFRCSEKCDCAICTDCMEGYLKHLYEEKMLPRCLIKSCEGEFLHSMFLTSRLLRNYEELCYLVIKNNNADLLLGENNVKLFIQKIRNDKKAFLERNFPLAIQYVINTSLKSKMKTISKTNQEIIQRMSNNTIKKIKCLNILCTGVLDIDGTCLLCSTVFCRKCERKKTGDHECKQEDIDSIAFVKGLVCCPKCRTPVLRSWGCDNITCSICHINFNYISGNTTLHGNHDNATLTLKNDTSIVAMIGDGYSKEMIDQIREFENRTQEDYPYSKVLQIFKKFEENPKSRKEISRRYEIYRTTQENNKKYFRLKNAILNNHNDKTLTIEVLNRITMHYY